MGTSRERKPKRRRFRNRHIAVLIETEDAWGRDVVRGIADYARQMGHWLLLIDPRDEQGRPALPGEWVGDGVIVRLGNRRQATQIRRASVPAVNVDTIMLDQPGLGHVITDDGERARLALNHFRERGFTRFASFSPPSYRYSDVRGRAFCEAVAAAGFSCANYSPGYRASRKIGYSEKRQLVTRWLHSLPRPVGVFTVDAHQGRQLAEVCQTTGVSVPDDVAILAGDTDELMCTVSSPQLSSVRLAARRIGHEAAVLLDGLMHGRRPPRHPIKIKPLSVVSRHSTDVLAIDNDDVVRAIRFIQEHATQGIRVADVLQQVSVSRRALELQFRQYLEDSPSQLIGRVRLERAKNLLIQTDMSIEKIAGVCGFSNATRLGVAFNRVFGTTPRAYRCHARNH